MGVGRFPSVAFLQCCARNYEQPAAGAQQMRCFAKGCTQTACPARQILGGGACSSAAVPKEQRRLGFKYRDEGFSAILHATALSFPGARLNFAADRTPPRLDIRLPASLGAQLARPLALTLAPTPTRTLTLTLTPTLTLTLTTDPNPNPDPYRAAATRCSSAGRVPRAARTPR